MKAPLLIQFDENGNHTVHAFPNMPAYRAQLAAEEERARANGLKVEHVEATHQHRKTDLLIVYRGKQPAPMPTLKEVRAILKGYKEAQR